MEELPLLSVSIHHGVVQRAKMTDRETRADDISAYKRVEPGDVVLNRMRAFQGGVGISRTAGLVPPDYMVLRATPMADPVFLQFLVKSVRFVGEMSSRLRGIGAAGQGNVRTPRIYWDDLGAIQVSVPEVREQQAVASFLDRETARIDGVVERKERLVGLLQQRRQVLVDRATVPGIATGSDDWPVVPLRKLAGQRGLFTDGDWIETPFITEEGIRLIQTGNVGVGEFRDVGFRYVSEATFSELRCTEVLPGDVLICRLAQPVGRACLAPSLGVRMITSVDVCILRVRESVDPRFLVAYLSSSAHLSLMESIARGGTRERLSRDQLGQVVVPSPPVVEQRAIADRLARETQRLDVLQERLLAQVRVLREHRQALITAAVTGGSLAGAVD